MPPENHPPPGARLALRLLALPLEVRDREQPADAIVVVGSPLTQSGALTAVGEERVRAGVELWRRGLAPILCVSGGGPGRLIEGMPREADVMAARARALGVSEAALRVERTSRSTAENARLSAALLAADGCRRVWLVTQPFHTRRCRFWFRRAGLEALAWSAPNSLQYLRPGRGARWVVREYASWARMALLELKARRRGARVGRGSRARSRSDPAA